MTIHKGLNVGIATSNVNNIIGTTAFYYSSIIPSFQSLDFGRFLLVLSSNVVLLITFITLLKNCQFALRLGSAVIVASSLLVLHEMMTTIAPCVPPSLESSHNHKIKLLWQHGDDDKDDSGLLQRYRRRQSTTTAFDDGNRRRQSTTTIADNNSSEQPRVEAFLYLHTTCSYPLSSPIQ